MNDIAFSHPSKQLCIITCGDDKTIKVRTSVRHVESQLLSHPVYVRSELTFLSMLQVWDAVAGRKQYTFEGHEAPVYSVCPHHKESIQVLNFSKPDVLTGQLNI